MAISIESRIHKARPRLSIIAPLTNAVILSFVMGNLIIGYGLWILPTGGTMSRLPIVNGLFSFQFYAVIFALISLTMFWGWLRNNWDTIRHLLLFGVLFKSIWTVALVFSVLQGGSVSVLGAWLTLLAVQMSTYIFFIKPPESDNG